MGRACSMRHSVIAVLGVILSGCVAVGTGTRTVIKARSDNPTVRRFFPHYVTSTGAQDGDRVAVFRDNVEPAACMIPGRASRFRGFQEYLRRKYGVADPQSAAISLEVRDLGRVPTLSASLQALTSAEVIKIMTDNTLTDDQKLARKDLLLAQLLNAPQSFEIKTLNRLENGCELFYYYPHLEVEFSADVFSPNISDRFSELVFLIRLSDSDAARQVRVVNFDPKATDIAEFTRGTFKDQTQAYIKATYGLTRSASVTNVARTFGNPGDATAENTQGTSVSPTLGGEAGYSYTEGYERDLKDAIERKTYAVIEDGRTFLVDLRALRHVRIGGSYAFDLMLEIPSTSQLMGQQCVSVPAVDPSTKSVKAEVTLLGVVRHVDGVGRTGVLRRVPEAENDDVYEEVILRQISDLPLWVFNGEAATRPDTTKPAHSAVIDVVSNVDDARFVVVDSAGVVLGEGGGKRSRVEVTTDKKRKVSVRFFKVIRTSQTGKTSILATDPAIRTLAVGPDSTVQVIGEYQLRGR